MTADALAAAYTDAWNTGNTDAVAAFFAADGAIIINKGSPWQGRAGVAQMAAGFFADIPDLSLRCDGARRAGDHLVYMWTFTGTHVAAGNAVRVTGWEEWDLDASGLITLSRGWFDAEDYARQTAPK
ncbi:MAG: SgcJ/EcaC family oxidoreductase [Sphingomonadales bacterium]|nr:SgcJ/EcaC family oxidoreductase [Sphingomonadales bacterium]